MIKPLFVIGMCLILKGKDPWQYHTFKILDVGKSSYNTAVFFKRKDQWIEYENGDVLYFENQDNFEVTSCPKKPWW